MGSLTAVWSPSRCEPPEPRPGNLRLPPRQSYCVAQPQSTNTLTGRDLLVSLRYPQLVPPASVCMLTDYRHPSCPLLPAAGAPRLTGRGWQLLRIKQPTQAQLREAGVLPPVSCTVWQHFHG